MYQRIESDSYFFKSLLNVSITTPLCLQKISSNKLALGDDKGVLSCLQIKKSFHMEILFTTPESIKGNSISSVYTSKERIFFCIGNFVIGVSKKGKNICSLDNNMPILGCCVTEKNDIIFYNDFFIYKQDIQSKDEREMFLADDKILFLFLYKKKLWFASNDKSFKYINYMENFEMCEGEIQVDSVPSAYFVDEKKNIFYYGTIKGEIGIIDGKENKVIIEMKEKNKTVNCLTILDFDGNKKRNLIVGLNSGELRVYTLGKKNKLMFEKKLNEAITNCSFIHERVLVTSYSGKLFVLVDKNFSSEDGSGGGPTASTKDTNLMNRLVQEIRDKEEKLLEMKKKYLKLSKENIGTAKSYKADTKFFLVDQYYLFTCELNVPIDMIMFYSKIPLNILESQDNFDVIKSYSKRGTCSFIVKSLSDNQLKFEMKLRSLEGKRGDLEIFIVPNITPKIATKKVETIKPLSLHERVNSFDDEFPSSELSVLKISGSFGLQDIHNWVMKCLNDIPTRLLEKNELKFYYRSNYQNTVLKIEYKKREAEFYSNNISTISVLQEFITKEATLKKTPIKIWFKINFGSINYILENIYPKLEEQLSLNEKMKILESLKEINIHEKDTIKNDKYKELLKSENVINEKFKNQKINLQFLYDILVRLVVDKCKFKRMNSKEHILNLKKLLGSKKEITLADLKLLFK